MIAIITVTGNDHPGIIAAVTTGLAQENVNILDLSQQIMGGYFTMILRVNTESSNSDSITALQARMTEVGKKQAVLIRVHSEEIFKAVTQI